MYVNTYYLICTSIERTLNPTSIPSEGVITTEIILPAFTLSEDKVSVGDVRLIDLSLSNHSIDERLLTVVGEADSPL
jgi:hypothetical protein